jgi:hypothetical protein
MMIELIVGAGYRHLSNLIGLDNSNNIFAAAQSQLSRNDRVLEMKPVFEAVRLRVPIRVSQ